MALQKLQTTNAFVVRDLDVDTPAIGIVRSAPKILQGGAKELARSQTYQCAVFNMKYQGASAGVNATPDVRDVAFDAFCAELLPATEIGALMIDAGKGVSADQLQALSAADLRSEARLREIDGATNASHLTGLGAAVSAMAARSLDGASVAIENLDATGLAVAQAAAAAGAKVTALSTASGLATAAEGFDIDALGEAFAAAGPDLVKSFATEELPSWRILGVEADVLFVGSKMGVIDHKGAPNVKASLVVPTGSLPYTTKGALMLERQGTTVLPDFVTTAGALFASFPPNGDDQASIESAVTSQLGALTESIIGKDTMPILEACSRAETFIGTWRDELPFGRPFAA